MSAKRIVVTGMAINTPLGDNLDTVGMKMLAGQSAISQWKNIDCNGIYSKIGGELCHFDPQAKLNTLEPQLPKSVFNKVKRVLKQINPSAKVSVLMSVEAWLTSGLIEQSLNPYDIGIICGGHNLSDSHLLNQFQIFQEEPEFIDGLCGLNVLDTDHSSAIAEILNIKGFAYLVGGTCATGNLAMQNALQAIKFDNKKVVTVLCPIATMNPLMLQALTVLDAICFDGFNHKPQQASRPYDKNRSGFLPSEGGATLIFEELEHAKARGAHIYAELLAASVNSDANHLGDPCTEGQVHAIKDALVKADIHPQQVDYISAHATSTKLGDVVELNSIEKVFGQHAKNILINAPKSLLGHTMWASGAVESALAIWQMNHGEFHQSHNIDNLDPAVKLNVCATGNVKKQVDVFINNSFGMGGINSASVFKRFV